MGRSSLCFFSMCCFREESLTVVPQCEHFTSLELCRFLWSRRLYLVINLLQMSHSIISPCLMKYCSSWFLLLKYHRYINVIRSRSRRIIMGIQNFEVAILCLGFPFLSSNMENNLTVERKWSKGKLRITGKLQKVKSRSEWTKYIPGINKRYLGFS